NRCCWVLVRSLRQPHAPTSISRPVPSSTSDEGSGTAGPPGKAPMFGSGPETSLKGLSWINEPGSETRVKLADGEGEGEGEGADAAPVQTIPKSSTTTGMSQR